MSQSYRHLFGPVRSRRLGRSLGIDLAPFKVCSFDCCYCQVGATTEHTLERKEYVPITEVMEEFDHWLAHDGQADHLTLAGAGEPTLHSGFGDVLSRLAARSPIPRVLLSNGSLFHLPEVRAEACGASIVKGTLAAWDEASFQAVHHPGGGLAFATFCEGLRAMRAVFHGEYWLEVFLVPGLNDAPDQVARIAALAREIAPDRIHLNTAVRPSLTQSVQAVPNARLLELARQFMPVAEVSATASSPAPGPDPGAPVPLDLTGRIVALLLRHPCTAADIGMTMGVALVDVQGVLDRMTGQGAIRAEQRAGNRFYIAE